jgi:hypothetical protein
LKTVEREAELSEELDRLLKVLHRQIHENLGGHMNRIDMSPVRVVPSLYSGIVEDSPLNS